MEIEQINILVDTVQKISLVRDVKSVTEIVKIAARALTKADGATFIFKEKDKCLYVTEDSIEPLWAGQRFPIETCISGWVMRNKAPVMIEDVSNDFRIDPNIYKTTYVKSMLMVPIRTIDPIGAIGNYWASTHHVTEKELVLLQSLADITSVSIENIYAFQELENQNQMLYEIAFLQAHQVKGPIAQIKGLSNLFRFDDIQHPDNLEILLRLKKSATTLDEVIKSITKMTNKINFTKDYQKPADY